MAFSKEKAHERAERYAAKGQHDKAAREYQSIVDHDPKDIRAWLMLADCLARSGDPGSAVSRYMQVADYYASQKEYQKALAVYRQVLNLDPTRLDVLLKCANLNMEVGRVHDAIAAYEQIATAQLHAGKTPDAIRTFAVIADADPSVVSKRLRLAELYSREGMMPEAVGAFRAAADVLLQTDRKADYVRVAERLLYHENDDRETIRQLAKVYLEMGDARRALMKLNALLKADRHDQQGLELLAETFMALGKPDKASSVLGELVRGLVASGEAGRPEAERVLAKGLQWSPTEPSLLRLRSDLQPPDAPDLPQPPVEAASDGDSEALELDDDDVVELDDDDVVLDDVEPSNADEPAPTLEPVHHNQTGRVRGAGGGAPGMTASVVSEAQQRVAAGPGEGATDLDKILFEARVYVKYRLFDHALDHVDELLGSQPEHVGALSLRARALGELGRAQEAGDTHLRVARLVADRDPKLAQEHVDAALQAVPGHPEASSVQAALAGDMPAQAGAAAGVAAGDSSSIDLDESGSDFPIEIADEPAFEPAPSRHVEVENRFGISEAGPLPDRKGPPTEGTPPAGFVPMPPPDSSAAAQRLEETTERQPQLRRSPPEGGPQAVIEQPTEQFRPAPDEVSFEGEMDFSDVMEAGSDSPADDAADLEVDDSVDFIDVDIEPVVEDEEQPSPADLAYDTSEPPLSSPEPTPVPLAPEESAAAEQSWPDISDDLAEVRFFLDQGLDEDAEAALGDLREKHGAHPELVALENQLKGFAEPMEPFSSGAQPLIDLTTEEDEDEDAYLSAIFGESKPAAEPKHKVEVKASPDDLAGSNARDQFDLGMAYREMGLVDEAISQFEMASNDDSWRSRALVMMGSLQVHRGETDQAVANLTAAIESANTEDERCEARYELAVLYERVGDKGAAIEHLQSVTAGYRDRDERLVALQG